MVIWCNRLILSSRIEQSEREIVFCRKSGVQYVEKRYNAFRIISSKSFSCFRLRRQAAPDELVESLRTASALPVFRIVLLLGQFICMMTQRFLLFFRCAGQKIEIMFRLRLKRFGKIRKA